MCSKECGYTPDNKYDTIREQAELAIANDCGKIAYVCDAATTLGILDGLMDAQYNVHRLAQVAKHAAALFQKGGYFEYCVGSSHHKELQEALKKVGLL